MPDKPLPEPAELLLRLLEIESVSGSEGTLARYLFELLREHFTPDRLELQEVAPGRFNLIMSRGQPNLTFSSHLDTVPGAPAVRQEGEIIYGRGACDAKGQIVAHLCALERAIRADLGPYACFYVAGEEVDSIGAQKAVTGAAIASAYLLNGEPTGNRFARRSTGVLDCVVRAEGVQLHSAIAGDHSATHQLIRELQDLLEQSTGDFLVNVGMIEAPGVANMSCPQAQARVCIRTTETSEHTLARLLKTFKKCRVELVGPAIDPFEFYVPPAFESEAVTVPFCSDSPLYAGSFQRIMMYGPGSIKEAHTPHEFIRLDQLQEAIRVLTALALELSADTRP